MGHPGGSEKGYPPHWKAWATAWLRGDSTALPALWRDYFGNPRCILCGEKVANMRLKDCYRPVRQVPVCAEASHIQEVQALQASIGLVDP